MCALLFRRVRRGIVRGSEPQVVADLMHRGDRDPDELLGATAHQREHLGHDGVQQYLGSQQIEVAAEIPFRPEVAEAYAQGQIAAAASPELCSLLMPLGRFLTEQAAP